MERTVIESTLGKVAFLTKNLKTKTAPTKAATKTTEEIITP